MRPFIAQPRCSAWLVERCGGSLALSQPPLSAARRAQSSNTNQEPADGPQQQQQQQPGATHRMSERVEDVPSVGPSRPIRTLYPQVKLRARTQERPWHSKYAPTMTETREVEEEAGGAESAERMTEAAHASTSATSELAAHGAESTETAAAAASSSSAKSLSSASQTRTTEEEKGNEVQQFLEEVRHQVDVSRYERNQTIPYPEHPDATAPLFRRIKRHTKLEVVVPDPDFPVFQRRDQAVALPAPKMHPWVKRTPIGPHIVHGDGQINVHGGTGEVGFDDDPNAPDKLTPLPKYFRGLRHRSVIGHPLPQMNGKVVQDAVVRHSFGLTGRGVFATRDIKKGETIMVVQSTAQNTGVKGEINRLEEMMIHILLTAHGDVDGEDANELDEEAIRDARAFLHDWVLNGQPSSLMEHWPAAGTQRVVDAIGGPDVLYDLELHQNHIARLAAILDLNSFLVESFYAERKGMAYFPEAGFLNHSCVPNTTYDIIPAHTFKESDYYLDEALERDDKADEHARGDGEEEWSDESAGEAGSGGSSSSAAAGGNGRGGDGDDARVTAHAEDEGEGTSEPTTTTNNATTAVASSATKNVAHLGDATQNYPDLTEADAPSYLFCCRATEDIKAGDEILISYIPPSWTFDNRQYVLHDRYHFWCKCPKCAPTLDKKYAKAPKRMIAIIVFCILLQVLLLYQRDLKNAVEDDIDAILALPEDERIEALRARGIDIDKYTPEEYEKRRQARRRGFFEMLEGEKEQETNRFDDIRTRNPLVQQEMNSQGVKW